MRQSYTTRQSPAKRRYDRLAKQKERGSRRSFVTELENLQILLAWEAGELSEGQVARALNTDRVSVRDMKIKAIEAGIKLAGQPGVIGKAREA